MGIEAKLKERYQQLKKVVEKLTGQKKKVVPQPVLQPYRPKRFF